MCNLFGKAQRRALALSACVVAPLVFGACEAAPDRSPAPPRAPTDQTPDAELASLSTSGGLCVADDPAGQPCGSTFAVLAGGTWVASSGERGMLTSSSMARLRGAIDETEIAPVEPFTGTCPTAYDGSEVTVTYVRSGQRVEVASCSWVLDTDDVLMRTLTDLQASYAVGGR